VCVRRGSVGISPQSAAVYADAASDPAESKLAADDSPADPPEQSTTTSGQPVMCALFFKIHLIFSSVRPILRIGEYSLVALQHRRIRYIGLRVSADAE